MRRFSIYNPKRGQREDVPTILLDKAFTVDDAYVQVLDNTIRKMPMRTPELTRTTYEVSSVNLSTNVISIAGNNVTSLFPSGTTITTYDVDGTSAEFTLSITSTFSNTATHLTVTGNITSATPVERVFANANVGSNDPTSVDFLKVRTTDGNPIMRYERFTLSDATERLVCFTKAHIYYWETNFTRWDTLFTSSGTTTYWDAVQYGDFLCATNNVDRPLQWDGGAATVFENMDTNYALTTNFIAKAKFIGSYEDYIFLANVELSNGDKQQHHVYTSNISEGVSVNGFRQDTGKDAGAYPVPGDGDISGGFGYWFDYLIVFKSRSIRKFWFTPGDIPFSHSQHSPSVGCEAPGSVGNNWDGNLFFYGTDAAFREIDAGAISRAINPTVRDINPSLLADIRFRAVDEYGELRWAIPVGSTSTANNKVVVFKEGQWDTDLNIPVTAFGSYTRQSNLTWDTLPYDTWEAWPWDSWNAADESEGFPLELVADGDGFTYLANGGYQDNGDDYDSFFVISTDLADKSALWLKKRLHFIYTYVRSEATGTMSIAIKADNETEWQEQGEISLVGDEDILRVPLPVDVRAGHFLIKYSGTTNYRWIGMETEFTIAGDR